MHKPHRGVLHLESIDLQRGAEFVILSSIFISILFQLEETQSTMADVKANAEALVPKFKLDRVLNQGIIPLQPFLSSSSVNVGAS